MKDDVLHGRVRVFFAHAHGLSRVPATSEIDWLACVVQCLLATLSDDLHVMNDWSRTSVGQQGGPRPMVVCGVENKMRKCDTLRVKQRLQGRGIHYGHNYVQNAIERTRAERDGIIRDNIPRT